ncbi:hypothetical protein J4E85_007843 [Alternaria conjuncta]|uniref:uncharacterized protein n=1 Tax=Alternaria conjuncta TaxID=181017 RepID=UPI00221FF95A|nr:uncharacterized protein J4E85_007843 [Alternaria conjuncta]KAI4924726.1 hypothetical protein J4E85_007843 [Alternaria conjuncta]
MATKTTKRRKMRPYERKALVIEQLGFGRKQAFRDWRASDLVKPYWERFSKHFLDSFLSKSDKKGLKFVHVYTWIINGEKASARTFSARIDRHMWDFIAFEKRQRARGKGKGTASSSKTAPSSSKQLDLLEATLSVDAYEHRLRPYEGVASIF